MLKDKKIKYTIYRTKRPKIQPDDKIVESQESTGRGLDLKDVENAIEYMNKEPLFKSTKTCQHQTSIDSIKDAAKKIGAIEKPNKEDTISFSCIHCEKTFTMTYFTIMEYHTLILAKEDKERFSFNVFDNENSNLNVDFDK